MKNFQDHDTQSTFPMKRVLRHHIEAGSIQKLNK